MTTDQKIKAIVEKKLSCSAHNMDHVMRVYNTCMNLAKGKKVDMEVLKAAILLHDIARVKEDDDKTGKVDHAVLSAKEAEPILKKLGFPKKKIKHIQDCIISHRYKTDHKPKSLEAKILFDADKLDVTGAMGIARAFVWVGRNNAHIYRKVNLKEYIKENLGGKINGRIKDNSKHSPQIEYEIKYKFLGNKFFTPQARAIGRKRIKFFKNFLDTLEREVKGKI